MVGGRDEGDGGGDNGGPRVIGDCVLCVSVGREVSGEMGGGGGDRGKVCQKTMWKTHTAERERGRRRSSCIYTHQLLYSRTSDKKTLRIRTQ